MSDVSPPVLGRIAWYLSVIGSLATLLMLSFFPADSEARALLARGVGLVATGVFLWAVLRIPTNVRAVWWCLWSFMTITVFTDIIYDYQLQTLGEVPSPGITDVLYFSSYLFAFAGLFLLSSQHSRSGNVAAWVDAGIFTTAVIALTGSYIIGPLVVNAGTLDGATIVAIIYPVLDVLVLSALIRIGLGRGATSPAMALLVVAMTCFVIADLLYNIVAVSDSWSADSPVLEVMWSAALLSMTAAVLAPGARTLAAPTSRRADWVSPARLTALAIAVLTTPVLLVFALFSDRRGTAEWLSLVTVLVVILLIWRIGLLVDIVQRHARSQRELARIDGLTGLPNRRMWDEEFDQAVAQCRRKRVPLTVAVLDLDLFKEYNDQYGHQQGDDLLRSAANAWSERLPEADLLARYGGEEFGLCLRGLDAAGAAPVLESLRLAMPEGQTVSIGAAQLDGQETPRDCFRRADLALYQAKADGRNQVRFHDHQSQFHDQQRT